MTAPDATFSLPMHAPLDAESGKRWLARGALVLVSSSLRSGSRSRRVTCSHSLTDVGDITPKHHSSPTFMNRIWYSLLLTGTLLMVSCSKPPPPVPAPSTPVPTPHPARGAGEQAIRLYPDLAIKNSHFRRTFDELYEDQRTNSPKALTKVDWPLTLAHRTAGMLGVTAYSATPVPEATPKPPEATPKQLNSLERGAYDQRRALPTRRSFGPTGPIQDRGY